MSAGYRKKGNRAPSAYRSKETTERVNTAVTRTLARASRRWSAVSPPASRSRRRKSSIVPSIDVIGGSGGLGTPLQEEAGQEDDDERDQAADDPGNAGAQPAPFLFFRFPHRPRVSRERGSIVLSLRGFPDRVVRQEGDLPLQERQRPVDAVFPPFRSFLPRDLRDGPFQAVRVVRGEPRHDASGQDGGGEERKEDVAHRVAGDRPRLHGPLRHLGPGLVHERDDGRG